jgi:hypothetical protein
MTIEQFFREILAGVGKHPIPITEVIAEYGMEDTIATTVRIFREDLKKHPEFVREITEAAM